MGNQHISRWVFSSLLASMAALLGSSSALAQNTSPKPAEPAVKIEDSLLLSIGLPQPNLTPLEPVTNIETLPVNLLYDGPILEGSFLLEISLSKPDRDFPNRPSQLISQSTLHFKTINQETDAILN